MPAPHPLPLRLLAALLPRAEREEIVATLEDEFRERTAGGRLRAHVWLWRQAVGSLPWLLVRSWGRGWSGWESEANRLRPGGSVLESVVVDARHAVRRLRKRPAYTLLAVLTLGLGVGGTAAVYSLVRTLLVQPLPYARSEELVELWMPSDWSEAEYAVLSEASPAGLSGLAAWYALDLTLALPAVPAQIVRGVAGTAGLFEVLGVAPQLGRGFQAGDDRAGAEPVAVLSHAFWQQLGGDAAMVGSTLRLGGVSRRVVGVMPRGLWFPDPGVRVWVSVQVDPTRRTGLYTLIARLPDGARGAAAAAAVPQIARILDANFDYPPDWDKLAAPGLTPLRDRLLGPVRPVLLATLAGMVIILLISCANVAALMLGQVDERSTELAVRSVLGANRRQLLQQVVAEALALGGLASVVGAAIAVGTFGVLRSTLPLGALAERAALDWSVFAGAFAIALIAALGVALVPALSVWRGGLAATLSTVRTTGVAGRGGRIESGLVVAEVALAVLMATGAALLLRTVANLRAIDPGVNTVEVAVLDIVAGAELDAAARRRKLDELLRGLEALPGVRSAAAIQKLPLRGSGDNWGITVQGAPATERTTTAYRIVTPGYFDVMDQRLLVGRTFAPSDAGGETVVVINQALAEHYFPGVDPVGRLISTGYDTTWARVIGVVANARDAGLTDAMAPSRYMLAAQVPYAPAGWSLVLRTAPGGDPAALLGAARGVVERIAPSVAVQTTTTMGTVFTRAMGPARQLTGLLLLLAGLAVTLGAVGVYGVVSHFVHRRRRDWSIRIALGLRPIRLIGQIVGRGGALVGLGIVTGLVGSTLATRLLGSLLYGIRPTDPLALSLATAALLAIGLVAAFLPARRASRADPAAVLREQ